MTQPQTSAAKTVDTFGGLLEQPACVVVYLVAPGVVETEVGELVIAV
jgi:hypothetical protein